MCMKVHSSLDHKGLKSPYQSFSRSDDELEMIKYLNNMFPTSLDKVEKHFPAFCLYLGLLTCFIQIKWAWLINRNVIQVCSRRMPVIRPPSDLH